MALPSTSRRGWTRTGVVPSGPDQRPLGIDSLRAVAARAKIAEATVIAAPSPVRPQPNARKAKGGAPSDRENFAATVIVAGARWLSRKERSHDRRPRFQADRPRARR